MQRTLLWPKCSSFLCFSDSLAVVEATVALITPWQLLVPIINFWTFASNFRKKTGLSCFFLPNTPLNNVFLVLYLSILMVIQLKNVLSGRRQFLTTENHLKMKKNTFYFVFKAFLVLKIFKFLSSFCNHVEKRFD